METQTAKPTKMTASRDEELRRAIEIVRQLSARCERILDRKAETGEVLRHDLLCVALQGADMQDCFATIRVLDAKIVRAGNAQD
jgi:hypothetical protein